MPKIAVYAGHGGSDYGAVGNGLREKDLNLALSNEVTRILRQNGYDVINNRTTDVNRDIARDADLANRNNVDALVEIHLNSNPGMPQSGTETYYSVRDTGKGKALGRAINDRIVALGFKDRGVKTMTNSLGNDALKIIRLSEAPPVLVEAAFINSMQDMDKFNVNEVARAIAGGIMQEFPMSKPSAGDSVIRSIQSTLNQRYNTNLAVDGIAGAKTKQALVKGLQSELNRQYGANLVVDGVFGNATRAATKSVRKGARGNITYLIQAALYIKGYKTTPDGVFGDKTEAAVKEFQRRSGLTADGIVGPATQAALFK